jgi:hypothetical protein
MDPERLMGLLNREKGGRLKNIFVGFSLDNSDI